MKFAFFGTSRFSVIVLESLKSKGVLPEFIITATDKPQGRKMIVTPPPAKIWAIENEIPVHQFESLRTPARNAHGLDAHAVLKNLQEQNPVDVYIVASYGMIIPEQILSIPTSKTLNIHPSLLPLYRGASPLQSSIIDDQKYTGVTIIILDNEVDHGPIVAQKEINIAMDYSWPIEVEKLESILAEEGANLLFDKLPDYIEGNIVPTEQNHSKATFTKKFEKQDGFIDLENIKTEDDSYRAMLKTYAFSTWPGVFTYMTHKTGTETKQIRLKILGAKIIAGIYTPTYVIPESGKEMSYESFLQGLRK